MVAGADRGDPVPARSLRHRQGVEQRPAWLERARVLEQLHLHEHPGSFARKRFDLASAPLPNRRFADPLAQEFAGGGNGFQGGRDRVRSEEHTSELQSLMRISYAVFCLKKTKKNNKLTTT